ncbi:sialic acid-binding Ig-like lectin 16 [Paramisgurnus dabryanus]|uniref:sialic acid-binding Ig-like lectin 16 n=1 Tax=Paramisgurnus dabryanus TaxID=90735 RepID=UPI003CCEF9B5
MQCASDPEWWSSIAAQTLSGGSPFPPQRDLPLRDYALAVESSKGCYPEVLASAYLVAGMNDPPSIRERAELLHLPYWDLVDRLDRRQQPPRSAETVVSIAPSSNPRGILTGAVRLGRSTPVPPVLETFSSPTSPTPALDLRPASSASRRRRRRTKDAPDHPPFNYPSEGKTYNEFTGIWYKDASVIYHKETSKIIDNFKDRTTLLGDLHHKNCTLKINSLQHSDTGPYMFRIEIKDLDKYSYQDNKVSITVKDSPEKPIISVNEEVMSQKETTATCIVSHSCPSDQPPQLTWSLNGTHTSQSLSQDHGQWKIKSSLTFTPSREDHNKPLSCSANYSGGKKVTSSKTLKVKYPPYNVNVKSNLPVKENTSVELICSCDSNPPASFQWISSNGSVLANGPTYKLNNVSRYTEAISCTANNTEGQNSSSPHKINVLYPPEIKNGSFCKSETTVCVCIVDSNPPSEVKWFGPSGAFPSSSIEQKGFRTIFTLQGWEGFPDTIHCSASNSEGNSVITLQVPNHRIIIYIAVATVAVLVTLVVISICVAKRHCRRRAEEQHSMDLKADNEMKTTPKSGLESKKEKSNGIYRNNQDDFVDYENWGRDDLPCGQDEDQAVYANK